MTLSEVHEKSKSLISLAKGFFLGSVLTNLVIYGFCAVLEPVLIRKDIGETLCIVQRTLLIGQSLLLPFVPEEGQGHEDRQLGLWGHSAVPGLLITASVQPQPPTHRRRDSSYAEEECEWLSQSPLLRHHLKDAWDVSRADFINTGCIFSTSVESRYLWSRKPATQCPLPLLPETQLCRQLNSWPSFVRLHSPPQLLRYYITIQSVSNLPAGRIPA